MQSEFPLTSEKSLHNFWVHVQSKYLKLPDKIIKHSLPFEMNDNFKLGYSNLLYVMSKQRNLVKVKPDECFKPFINSVDIKSLEKITDNINSLIH